MKEKLSTIFNKTPIMVLSTAGKDAVPNVVVIGSKIMVDENTIWTIDTFHQKTKMNILENEMIAIALWDGPEGYQIKGRACYHSEGAIFDAGKEWILKTKPNKIVKGVIEVKITEVYSLTPTYEEAGRLLISYH